MCAAAKVSPFSTMNAERRAEIGIVLAEGMGSHALKTELHTRHVCGDCRPLKAMGASRHVKTDERGATVLPPLAFCARTAAVL